MDNVSAFLLFCGIPAIAVYGSILVNYLMDKDKYKQDLEDY